MSPILCRTILADHASRMPLWEALRSTAPADLLTPLDPGPFASWDVSALSAVYQVGAGPTQLLDILTALACLQACKFRICYSRNQDHLLAVIEKRERTPVDIAAMGRELLTLTDSPSAAGEEETPLRTAPANGAAERSSGPWPRGNDPAALPLLGLQALVIVDDEVLVRSICTRILQTRFVVFETGGSHDALALADRLPFPVPLLISDVSLPRMDGVTLADRWLKRFADARVLLLSGHPYSGILRPAISFLQKPFVADELTQMVLRMAEESHKVHAH